MTTLSTVQNPVRTDSDATQRIRDIARAALALTNGDATYEYTPTREQSTSGTGIIQVSVDSVTAEGLLKCDRSCARHAEARGRDPQSAHRRCRGCNTNFHPIAQAKVEILWELLDPTLDLVGRIARSNPKVSEYVQDKIRQRLEEVLEQKVLQNPRTLMHATEENGLDLNRLINETPQLDKSDNPVTDRTGRVIMNPPADPVAWARRILFGSLAATTKRVFNNENKSTLSSFQVDSPVSDGPAALEPNLYRDIITLPPSAEEQYITEEQDLYWDDLDQRRGETVDDVQSRWEERSRSLRGEERLVVDAEAIHTAFLLPRLTVPATNAEIRELADLVAEDPSLIHRSLVAFRDLVGGEPLWSQRDIPDEMIALWEEYTLEQAERLLDTHPQAPDTIVTAALTLPKKPGRNALRGPRQLAQAASGSKDWQRVAGHAFDTFIAEHFAWFSDHDHKGRTAEARARYAELAAAWPAAADAVIAWSGSPTGRQLTTREDVADWLHTLLAVAGDAIAA